MYNINELRRLSENYEIALDVSVDQYSRKETLYISYYEDGSKSHEGIFYKEEQSLGYYFLKLINLDINFLKSIINKLCNIRITDCGLTILQVCKKHNDLSDFKTEKPYRIIDHCNMNDYIYSKSISTNTIKNIKNILTNTINTLINTHIFFSDCIDYSLFYDSEYIYDRDDYLLANRYSAITFFITHLDELIENINIFRSASYYCLCLNGINEFANLSTKKRFFIYYNHIDNKLSDFYGNHEFCIISNYKIRYIDKNFEATKINDMQYLVNYYSNKELDANPVYNVWLSFSDILSSGLMSLVETNTFLRKCNHCDKYFISKGKYDTNYCSEIYPNTTKTCQQIGAIQNYQNKVAHNPILQEYQKAYKRNYARISNKKITNEEFRLWVDEATTKRDIAAEQYQNNPNEQIVIDFKEYLGNK